MTDQTPTLAAHVAWLTELFLDPGQEWLDYIRGAWVAYAGEHAGLAFEKAAETVFDAALAGIKEKAWDEGQSAAGIMLPTYPPKHPANPYATEAS